MGTYFIVVIAVTVWGTVTGFRKGIFRLMGQVLAVAFGISAVRLLAPSYIATIDSWIPPAISGFQRSFLAQTFTCSIIYIGVVWIVSLVTFPLGKILRVLGSGVLSSIAGALFRTFQYLMLVSIAYNLIVDMDTTGSLARTARFHDGNIVEGVMKIAPAVLGFPDGEEVGYYQQLEDAKKIS